MASSEGTRKSVSLDLGGTHYRVAVGTEDGTLEWRVSRSTDVRRGLEPVLVDIYSTVAEAVDAAGGRDAVAGIGVAAPGPLDPWTGVIYDPPNMPGWARVPLKDLFEQRFGVPTIVGNDANLAGVGEHRFGAGRGLRDVVYMTVSTGIGGGVIADNKLLLGNHGFAGEIGHMTVDIRGEQCACGNWGCLEALASGTSIGRHARQAVLAGARTILSALPTEEITAKAVTSAAYKGDEVAIQLLRDAGLALGVGVVNLAHLFNPARVILGGGVSINAGTILWDAIHEMVKSRTMRPSLRDLDVVPAGLGDDAGLLGGVALAFDITRG